MGWGAITLLNVVPCCCCTRISIIIGLIELRASVSCVCTVKGIHGHVENVLCCCCRPPVSLSLCGGAAEPERGHQLCFGDRSHAAANKSDYPVLTFWSRLIGVGVFRRHTWRFGSQLRFHSKRRFSLFPIEIVRFELF